MKKILFVCHGNICRSPMAEFIMKDMVSKEGLTDKILVSSVAATRDEEGNDMYPPAKIMLSLMGVSYTPRKARLFILADYENFDLIIGMDEENREDLQRLTKGDPKHKLHQLMDYTDRPGEVADPWYTGDFRVTYDDIVLGCQGLLKQLMEEGID